MLMELMQRIHSWTLEAPWIMLITLLGMLVIAWWVMTANDVMGWANRRARWLSIIVQAVLLPLLLFVMLWSMRVTLARTEYDFRRQHGRVSQSNLESVKNIWGRPHVQRDLVVSHYYLQPVTEEVRDNFGRIVKRTTMERRDVPQNSLLRTRGEVTLTRSERMKGTAKYPGFLLDCQYHYIVRNFAERNTTANFNFPLSPGQSKFDRFLVLVDGVDQSAHLSLNEYAASWSMPMSPGQEARVDISYASQGLQRFYYQVADVREIRDFLLILDLPDIPRKDINYPEGCIPPTRLKSLNNAHGSRLSWRMDRAITTRGMGIALPDPAQPGQQVARVLRYAWRGGMLLIVALVITAIAFGRGFQPLPFILVTGVYVGQFMLLAAINDLFPTFWIAWGISAAGAIILSALILGWRTAPPTYIALLLIFMGAFPLFTLPDKINEPLLLCIDVLTIIYLAALGIIVLRKRPALTPQAE